jgi:hypothetical protein
MAFRHFGLDRPEVLNIDAKLCFRRESKQSDIPAMA